MTHMTTSASHRRLVLLAGALFILATEAEGTAAMTDHILQAWSADNDIRTSWRKYSKAFHTTTCELAELATRAQPKTLILYHQMYFGGAKDTQASLLAEIRSRYKGKVISANDLDVY